MFLNNSTMNSHSHIFTNGKIVTHTHPLNNPAEDNTSKNHDNLNNQIVVFYGLELDFGDYNQFFTPENYRSTCFSRIINLNDINDYTAFLKINTGRSPPFVFA